METRDISSPLYRKNIFGVFFTIAMISYPISFTAWMELGEENQLSKRTYFAGIAAHFACLSNSSITEVPFCMESWRRLYPTVRLSITDASFIRFFLFSDERSTLLTGRKVLPSDHPNVSRRKPNL